MMLIVESQITRDTVVDGVYLLEDACHGCYQ
jgi:hypothetical protein